MVVETTAGFTEGSPDAPRRVLILHGYTGSPDGLRDLARNIAQDLDAYVVVPLLPGHGTRLEDLQHISFDEFKRAAHKHAQEVSGDKPLAIVGYCFGGYLAALMAQEFHPKALVLALTAYQPRFPLWLPGMAWLFRQRASWDKYLYQDEIEMRKNLFYYPRVPGIAQTIVNSGIAYLKKVLPELDMPILVIHTTDDPAVSPKSGKKILAASAKNPANESHLLPDRRHALFFGPHKDEDIEILLGFLKKNLK